MRFLPLAVLALGVSASLAAQEGAPRRPQLAPGADSCDAAVYFSHGSNLLERDPRQAAAAFYWAARLQPDWADALYARRIALLMSEPGRLRSYMEGSRRVRESPAVQKIDSLHYHALMLDPYLYRRFDRTLFRAYLTALYDRANAGRIRDAEEEGLFQYWMDGYLRGASPGMRAWALYSDRNFPGALAAYASALKGSREKSDLHAQRGRIFYLIGNHDSARVEMTLALEQLRRSDEKDLVYLYESKALYEHSIGLALEGAGDVPGAREAYARALQEDLSYYPAHLRAATMALAAGDTAAAVGSLELAVQVREDDAVLRGLYGSLLLRMGRAPEAVAQLQRAVELEPYYAAPRLALAQALEKRGDAAAASAAYRDFLARASRRNPDRRLAEGGLARLATPAAGTPAGGTPAGGTPAGGTPAAGTPAGVPGSQP